MIKFDSLVPQHLHADLDIWRILIERGLVIFAICSDCADMTDETIVFFSLGDVCYGIPTDLVLMIQPLKTYTPLPFTQPFIVGVVSVNGRLLAVVDLNPTVEPARTAARLHAMLLIVRLRGMDVGLLTDGVVAAPPRLWAPCES